jgi:hypothetical protein
LVNQRTWLPTRKVSVGLVTGSALVILKWWVERMGWPVSDYLGDVAIVLLSFLASYCVRNYL